MRAYRSFSVWRVIGCAGLSISIIWDCIGGASCSASPLFVVNTQHWSPSSKIWLANCRAREPIFDGIADKVGFLKPHADWKPESQLLDLVRVARPPAKYPSEHYPGWHAFKEKNQARPSVIYGLLDKDVHERGALYQFDAHTGDVMGIYRCPYPIKNGYLTVGEVYYDTSWHTIVLISANRSDRPGAFVLAFDVTNPSTYPSEPMLLVGESVRAMEGLILTAKPALIRFSNGIWMAALPSILKGKSEIILISFERPQTTITLKTDTTQLLFSLAAIDVGTRGYADALYAVDEEGSIWLFNLTASWHTLGRKIAHQVVTHPMKPVSALRNREGFGIDLLYLGRDSSGERGLVTLLNQQPMEERSPLELKKQLILSGHYSNFFITAGTLVLLPSESRAPITVLSPQPGGYRPIESKWLNGVPEGESSMPVQQSTFMHDLKNNQAVFITLDDSCQLNVRESKLNAFQYGRLVWRKMAE